jgi:hypothetical protein
MHRETVAELVQLNQGRFLPPGVKKRWWHWLIGVHEYPAVLLEAEPRTVVREGWIKKNLNDPPAFGSRPPPPRSQRAP